MANRNLKVLKTPSVGIVAIPFSFDCGAAIDGSFPLDSDGYALNDYDIDGYGSGYSVFRTGLGTYHVVLSDKWDKIIHVDASVQVKSDKVLVVMPQVPLKNPTDGTSAEDPNRTGNRIILKLLNESEAPEDLAVSERVSGVIWVDNSSV